MIKKLLIICVLLVASTTISAQEIFDAVKEGNLTKVKELIENNNEVLNARNTNQSTPLHIAVSVSNIEIAKYLIEKGADLNSTNAYQWTPLFFAKNGEMAKLLIDSGANVNSLDNVKWSVLMQTETLDAAKVLIENGADINYETPNLGSTALYSSLWRKKLEIANYLLELGVKIKGPSSTTGVTELKSALQAGCVKYLDRYLELGYSIKMNVEGGNNLIHYAAESNSVELIKKITELGIPLDEMNSFGWSPLHIAAYKNNDAAFKFFLEKGLDKNSRTVNGKSAYNLAKEKNNKEIIDILVSIKADTSGTIFPSLTGEYLGQRKPGSKPEPFAPEIVAAQCSFHSSIIFTPDGNEAYWSECGSTAVIYFSKNVSGKWTEPSKFSNGDSPFISPNGNKFYFVAHKGTGDNRKELIYVRDRTHTGWSEPRELSEIVNSIDRIHWQVSVDKNENIYFCSFSNNQATIYYSEYKNGNYSEPHIIDELKDIRLYSPFISPDGSYLFATDVSNGSLNIFFRKKDGSWTSGINLSNHFQLSNWGRCSFVTPDGNIFFLMHSTVIKIFRSGLMHHL